MLPFKYMYIYIQKNRTNKKRQLPFFAANRRWKFVFLGWQMIIGNRHSAHPTVQYSVHFSWWLHNYFKNEPRKTLLEKWQRHLPNQIANV